MNTGNHIFRDYCKAENSDDEENYNDLQSRLYAQIYYAPSTRDEQSQKEITNQESSTDTNTLCMNVSSYNGANQTEDSKDFQKSLHTIDSEIITKDNITASSGTALPQDTDVTVTESVTNIVMKEEDETLMDSTDNSMATSESAKDSNTNDCQSEKLKSLNAEQPANAVDESSITNVVLSDVSSVKPHDASVLLLTDELSQSQMIETNALDNSVYDKESLMDRSINSAKENQDTQSTPESNKESVELPASCNKKGIQTNCVPANLLKKYEFAKRFINKLYEEKYRELEKRLQECETGEEPSKLNETDEMNMENQTNKSLEPGETEEHSKYTVIGKKNKEKNINKKIFQLTDSKDDSDTDESVFEVPIPPKPQPPLINLQDSDEESETGNGNSSSDDSDSSRGKISNTKIPLNKNREPATTNCNDNDTVTIRSNTIMRNDSESSTSSCAYDPEESHEDIVLNCTEIRKGAASLDEIKQMSKNVQKNQNLKGAQSLEQQNNCIDQYSKDADTLQPSDVSNKTTCIGTAFPECMSFDDDTCIIVCNDELPNTTPTDLVATNVDLSDNNAALEVNITSVNNQVKVNKKRHYSTIEADMQVVASTPACNSLKDTTVAVMQPSTSTNIRGINNQVSTVTQQQGPSHPPMSDALKSFYNDPLPHANVEVEEIQRNMSKDPRMWAILDTDLMPSPSKRQRFWNVKCTHCHRDGHLRHTCLEPRRPVRCYMCGTQGHTESRCPGKMCLTCGKKQGSFRKTCESCRTFFCTMCSAIGHKSTECPDLWRRYHQTTKTSELQVPRNLTNVMKPANRLFCCNCTKRGHDSSTCREYRWSQHFPTPAHVSNYMTGPKYTEDCDNNLTKSSTQHTVTQPCTIETAQVNISVKDKEKQPMPRADFIPLGESSEPKDSPPDSSLFTKEQLNGAIYICGVYVGDTRHSYTATFQMGNKKGSHVEGLISRHIFPTFLEKLAHIANFRVVVYNNKNAVLMACIRSPISNPKPIQKLVYQWATVPDIEKKSRMFTDLPFNKSELLLFIKAKLAKLEECTGDAYVLKKKIDAMKASLKPGMCTADVPQLLHFQSKLNMLINSKPKEAPAVERLRKYLSTLETAPGSELPMIIYLNVLLLYNQIFMPYTMLKLDELVRKCHNKTQLEREEENARKQGNKRQFSVSEQTNSNPNKKQKGGPSELVQANSQQKYLHPPIVNGPSFQPYTTPDVANVFGPLVYNSFSDGSLNSLPPIIPFHSDIPINIEPATMVPNNPTPPSLAFNVPTQPVPPPLPPLPPPQLAVLPPPPPPPQLAVLPPPPPPLQVPVLPTPPPQLPVLPPPPLQLPVLRPKRNSTLIHIPLDGRKSPIRFPYDPAPQLLSNDLELPKATQISTSVSCVSVPQRGPVHPENEIECIDLSNEPSEDFASSKVKQQKNRDIAIPTSSKVNQQSSNIQPLKQTSKKKKNDLRKELCRIREERAKQKIVQKAWVAVAEAYDFRLPHMDKAAQKIENKIKEKAVTKKHIKTLRRLITLEGLHRQEVNNICSNLK